MSINYLNEPMELMNYLIESISKKPFVATKSFSLAISQAVFVTNRQSTYSTWIKNQNSFFKESISASKNIVLGERSYLDHSKDSVKYFRTIDEKLVKSPTDYDFSSLKEKSYSYKDYLDHFGVSLLFPLPYDFDVGYLMSIKLKKKENGYIYSFKISPKALENYGKFMLTTTEDATMPFVKQVLPPEFKSVSVTLCLNKDFLPLKAKLDEIYTLKSLFTIKTEANCVHVFSYDEEKIPSISEKLKYPDFTEETKQQFIEYALFLD